MTQKIQEISYKTEWISRNLEIAVPLYIRAARQDHRKLSWLVMIITLGSQMLLLKGLNSTINKNSGKGDFYLFFL